jgi:ATP synthase protein I
MFFNKGKYSDVWDAILAAGMVGLHLVTATFVGAAMGYFLDDWLGTKPWLFLFMLVMGIVAGFRMVIQDVKKIQRSERAARQAEREGAADTKADTKRDTEDNGDGSGQD